MSREQIYKRVNAVWRSSSDDAAKALKGICKSDVDLKKALNRKPLFLGIGFVIGASAGAGVGYGIMLACAGTALTPVVGWALAAVVGCIILACVMGAADALAKKHVVDFIESNLNTDAPAEQTQQNQQTQTYAPVQVGQTIQFLDPSTNIVYQTVAPAQITNAYPVAQTYTQTNPAPTLRPVFPADMQTAYGGL